ncbi:polysaccharide deacetylase family protein [Litoribaculum gwangyangense]|uniref:polysaccharide deacetylase family protein n=1 Tax=Litoribaculum gwangyangense TaxID=1130722 RepID=UPI0031E7A5D9
MLLLTCNDDHETTYIQKQNFNEDWSFKLLDTLELAYDYSKSKLDDTTWEKVDLPHTPKIEPKIVNNQWQGTCWYRKNFDLDENLKDKKLFLKFEGAMNIAEVWVNGEKLIEHHGGYLPFIINFTKVAHFNKKNTVAVKLNNHDNPITGPKPLKILDFNTYGGLYRSVWLIAKNALHITDPIEANKTASGGIFVTYPHVSKEKAIVKVKSHIQNDYENSVSFVVKNTLLKDDKVALVKSSNKQKLEAFANNEVTTEMELENPELWSPNYPNLYKLVTEIIKDGVVVDKEITRIGIKTMKFIGQDFYLNGEKTFLRGVNRHQEYPYIGYALSDNANYRDANKIKDAGFDYVRLSHYPQAPAFMDACDELGLVTIDAILGWQYYSDDKRFQSHVFQTARDLIRRDRNHASVMAWEVSLNESWMPEAFIDSLTAIAHREYPGDQCFTTGWQPYGYDIFLQARQHRLKHYDESLKKPYNVSEYGDWEYYAMNAGLDQDSWGNLLQEERSSRQLRGAGEKCLLQQATNIQEAHNDNLNTPAFADGYWAMFDYNRGYANDLEASGIMDIFRLPKPSYYFFKSQRDHNAPFGEPMVFIANHWQKDSPLDVRIFSNCDEVELFLNGKSLGRNKPDKNRISNNLKHPPFIFKVNSFEEGKLEAKGYINNNLVASHLVQTPKKPNRIEVVVDNKDCENLKLETNDIFFVNAFVKDENGMVVPDYTGEITFSVGKGVQLIGENPVNCEAGIASILIKTSLDIKDIELHATSSDILNSSIGILAKERVVNDSLPLIPKLFLQHERNNKGSCLIRGDLTKKQIALTFDDGPTDMSRKIMSILDKHNAKATFFWMGEKLEGNMGIIKQAKDGGHLIGFHGWNHDNILGVPNESLWKNQIKKFFQALSFTGADQPKYFRPPYGAISQDQISFLADKEVKTVLWSLTTMDWDKTQNDEGQMFEKFKNHIHNGAIVLLHDFDFGNPDAKLKDLEEILIFGKSKGFEFVSIEELL